MSAKIDFLHESFFEARMGARLSRAPIRTEFYIQIQLSELSNAVE